MEPNIIFILIDGLRADQCFGTNKTSITPNIDSLIKNGIYFKQAFSCADGTTLTLNAILNSLFPFRTGTRTKRLVLTESNYISFLKKSGYNIYGLAPQVAFFDTLYRFFENNDSTYYAGPPAKHISDTGKKILKLLESKTMKEPWFYYIHLLDTTALRQESPPYGIGEFYDEKFGKSPYERIVSSIDFGLGEIFKKIDMKNILIVLTADHGALIPLDNKGFTDFEPNFEFGLKIGKTLMPKYTHKFGAKFFIYARNIIRKIRMTQTNRGLNSYQKRSRLPYYTLSLYDETIHVPLIFSGCDISHKIITQQVSTIDIFPTIVEIIGLSFKQKIDGRSLVPFFHDKKLEEKSLYLHTMPYEKTSPYDMVGIRTSQHKYFRSANDPTKNVNLYNLQTDPLENDNIADIYPKKVMEMEKILTKISSDADFYVDEISEDETKRIEEELHRLGYM